MHHLRCDMKEESIKYENSVGYVVKINGGYEIRLNRRVYSMAVGKTQSMDGAKRFLDRCESNPKNVEKLIGR